jgi:hypothetical protein
MMIMPEQGQGEEINVYGDTVINLRSLFALCRI